MLTTCVIVALLLYTLQTKRDFLGWGPAIFAVFWVLIMAGFLQVFLPLPDSHSFYCA